jgi:hypothetical protein
MLSVRRFLPGAGKVVTTGLKGTGDALKQAAARVGENAVAGAGQSVVGDIGKTVGTDKGVSVDFEKAGNAGLTSGVTAGALATPKAISDVRGAVRDRAFGGENTDATTQVANRIEQQAKNASSDGKTAAGLKNINKAGDAVTAAKDEIKSELSTELSALKQRGQYETDTHNAFNRAADGTATKADVSHIADVTAQDPASSRVVALARQAVVMNKLLDQGVFRNGQFKGGIAARIGEHAVLSPTRAAAISAGALAAHGAFPAFGIYSLPALGAAAGGWAVARGIDRLTGARSPANRFVEKFANGNGVRPDVVTPPAPPQTPVVPPSPGSSPVPKIAPMPPSPWGYEPTPSSTPDPRQLLQQMRALEVARNVNRKQTVDEAMPALRQLAAANQPAEQAPAPEPTPTVVPKDILSNARSLMRGLATTEALKQKTLGENQAQAEAQASPMLEQSVGGPEAVANPAAGKRMRELIGGAKALMTLRSDPAAASEAKETAQAETAATKAEAQAAKAADRKARDEQKAADRKAREEAKTTALAQKLASQATKQATRDAAAKAKADAKAVADRVREEAKAKALADKLAAKAAAPVREQKAGPKAEKPQAAPERDQKAEPEPYTPYSDAELTYQGMDHADVADAKIKAKFEKTGVKLDPEAHARERAAIIRGRGNDEALISKIADKATGKDKGTLYQVLEELHHRSSRSQTKAMRDHFAAQLPKELGDELRSALNDQWIGRNKHRP